LVDAISFFIEKKIITLAFFYISQAFDRVWHEELLSKIKTILYSTYYMLIKSHLTECYFNTKIGSSYSSIAKIRAGVPQGGSFQTFQNNILRKITNCPPYISNLTLHTDLKIKTVHEKALNYYKRFHSKLPSHINPLISNFASLTIP
jgi:hypothetical protein